MSTNGHDAIWMGAVELIDAYRRKTLSALEVTRAVLARIDALNPKLNCFCLVDHASALRDAAASEARWFDGEPLGPLDGVPVSIKDLILTKGWPTLRGSLTIDPAGPWNEDAPCTARLREAGAGVLGKTTTPEFGWRGSTDSPLTGITRNPWRLDVTPGGSSGGATAAVAAGLGPLAVGTDGGGSVRIPAAVTATVGLKPQFGRVPAYPLSPMGNVAHLGPQARTVADAALMLRVLAQPDVRDWTALPPIQRDWTLDAAAGAREGGLRGLRIAYSPRLGCVPWVDARVAAAVEQAAHKFAALGATVEQEDPPLPDTSHAFRVHWFCSARHMLRGLPPEKLAMVDAGLRLTIEHAQRFTLADYLDAQATRARAAIALAGFMQRYDLLLTPATAVPPFAVGRYSPSVPGQPPDAAAAGGASGAVDAGSPDWTWWTPFTYPFNLTQQPAIVLCCGFTDDGLPLALQLVAPAHREDLCLRAAAGYEAGTSWHRRRPPIEA